MATPFSTIEHYPNFKGFSGNHLLFREDLDFLYGDMLKHILTNGTKTLDRTGVGTTSVFGHMFEYDMTGNISQAPDDTGKVLFEIPVLRGKRIPMKSLIAELVWFLEGSTCNNRLNELGSTIWDEWAKENGDLGPIYGEQWRRMPIPANYRGVQTKYPVVDQIFEVCGSLINNPTSRRHIVNAYNPAAAPLQSLPACHALFQFSVRVNNDFHENFGLSKSKLDLLVYQRSADAFLGVPFNIASYGILLSIMALATGKVPGKLKFAYGDLHIYSNHMDQVGEYLNRLKDSYAPLHEIPYAAFTRPEGAFFNRVINCENTAVNESGMVVDSPINFGVNNFKIFNYRPLPAIKAEVAV